ncbi:MAG: caspase family protein [Thermodesulfobacteriota bacterium]
MKKIIMSLIILLALPAALFAADCGKAKGLIKEANGLVSASPSKAERLYAEAATLCPKSAAANYNLGISKYTRGDYAGAEIAFKKALKLKPDSVEAMNGLALTYAAEKKAYGKAKALIKKALKLRPGDRVLKNTLRLIEASRMPPYLAADLVVKDTNGNNILDAGEDIAFALIVKNKGKGPAMGLKADLDAPSFLKGLKPTRFGNIMPGEKKEKIFRSRVPYTVKTGEYTVKVAVMEESGRYGAPPLEITLPVKAPVPPKFFVKARVDDDMAGYSQGNGNGVIEKGETIEVHLTVRNRGKGVARAVKARLKTKEPGIFLQTPDALLGNIPPGRQIEGTLVFSVPWSFKGKDIPVEIVIEEKTGIFTARSAQSFKVSSVAARKRKLGATLKAEEAHRPQAEFTFETPHADEALRLAEKVHEIRFKQALTKKNYYALVIGIEKYRDIKTGAHYAARDARWVGEYFRKGLGIPKRNIRVLINEKATKSDIDKNLTWLKNRVRTRDAKVFVYYSGHGAPNIRSKGAEAYIVPYDGDPDYLESTAYPLKSMYSSLGDLPSKNIVVALDSCFSGRGDKSVVASGVRPMFIKVKNPFVAKNNTVVLAAGRAKEVSSSFSAAGHGLFTYYFLRGLNGDADADGNGWVNLKELYGYLSPKVTETAEEMNREQHPVISPGLNELGKKSGFRLTRMK